VASNYRTQTKGEVGALGADAQMPPENMLGETSCKIHGDLPRIRVHDGADFIARRARRRNRSRIKVSSLTLPVFNPLVWNIMKALASTSNTAELEQAYPPISAFYAAFATGETDVLIGGPTILQKLYQEGVPVRIVATGFTLADLVIFAKDDKIKSLADLKGKQLAVDMGGSQFQVTKMYLAAKGIDLGKDIMSSMRILPSRAQLEAGRVDAALVIEPLQHYRQSIPTGTSFQRRTGLEGNHRQRRLGNRDRNASRRDRKEPEGTPDAARRVAGRRRRHAQGYGRRRQDRERDPQAAAWNPHRRGREQAAADDHQARLGSRNAQVHHRHDGARGQGRLLREDADEKIIYTP
jgi:hypothetical protein